MAITIVNYPAGLPQILHVEGYSEESPDILLESDTGNGIPKRRPKTTRSEEPVSGTQILDATQWATLKSFFRGTALYGAVAVRWDFRDEGDEIVVIRSLSRSALGGDLYRVSFDLRVLP